MSMLIRFYPLDFELPSGRAVASSNIVFSRQVGEALYRSLRDLAEAGRPLPCGVAYGTTTVLGDGEDGPIVAVRAHAVAAAIRAHPDELSEEWNRRTHAALAYLGALDEAAEVALRFEG
jgi:hypothetical protein